MGREAVIVEAKRLPTGKRKGMYVNTRPEHMLSSLLKGLVENVDFDPMEIKDLLVGCVTQTAEQGNNIARISALMAGLPKEVAAMTLNRKCGSSQEAINQAAQGVIAGDYDVVIAAGIENMTRVPIGEDRVESPSELTDRYEIISQGISAERIATKWEISRQEMDELALRSHQLASRARENGDFKRETLPIELEGESVSDDEGIRPNTSLEKLGSLKSAFSNDGLITAGNSSQISDGAAGVIIMSREKAEELNLKPRARIIARGVIGSDPTLMLEGPIPLTKQILDKAGLKVEDIDVFECNEAFASVVLAWMKEYKPNIEKVNPRGGAIALGHPTGASGARIMTTLLHELEDMDKRFGLQVMCCGGGMATATIIERL
ncbi:thiolase family protein [Salinibacillus xinjiangensis]|uniref:Acetyl-CoA C-acyltransferase n=1 Tax=Salinibacillus xinjiangensis TaxID=1229268 RepID=A0A6G1X1M4_9BACI|nr:thiolase family protein [Salinibacillus xinjiangensis]MRG84883.1 acetyl-CoA C-acyltransferase [Salinibacillus xinjiangensis]